jgi:Transposase/3-demethylubiquinone-9 3-methyltransferase
VDGSPPSPWVSEPVPKPGAPSTGSKWNPNSRLGRDASPYSQGRVMEQSSIMPTFVGIDVSKNRLDVHVRPLGQSFSVARDGEGLAQLCDRLRELAPKLVVLEATGGFEVTVAATLAGERLPLAVVNPRQIRDFARATGRLAKTDALDAQAIALFAERIRPEPRPIADADSQQLAELVARRRIAPCLWFDGKAEEAMKFYTSIFKNAEVTDEMRWGAVEPAKKGLCSALRLNWMARNSSPSTAIPCSGSLRRFRCS